MTAFPTPEKLAELAALSRRLRAAGAPPPIDRTISIDEEGYVFGICPGDRDGDMGVYVHAGIRLGWAPMPLLGGLLVSLWGGQEAQPGFEEEGVTAFITPDGLRRLAADLVAIADSSEPA